MVKRGVLFMRILFIDKYLHEVPITCIQEKVKCTKFLVTTIMGE